MNYLRTYGENELLLEDNKLSTFYIPRIGEIFQGGSVFYVYPDKRSGLIVGLYDLPNNGGVSGYGVYGTFEGLTGGTFGIPWAETYGWGEVYKDRTVGNTANGYCRTTTTSGYTDWYLPSYYEMYNLRYVYSLTGVYWTHTEIDATRSWVSTGTGSGSAEDKRDTHKMRPIRTFRL